MPSPKSRKSHPLQHPIAACFVQMSYPEAHSLCHMLLAYVSCAGLALGSTTTVACQACLQLLLLLLHGLQSAAALS